MASSACKTPPDEIKHLLLRELSRTWSELNRRLFRDAMSAPVLEWGDAEKRLGSWTRTSRRMCISWSFARDSSWEAVKEVLKHEMAHQYVDEVLRIDDETAHGPAFQRTCLRLGIDSRAAGSPNAGAEEERIIRKIRALLALAESPNLHEAQAAAASAQRLMLRHNVETSTHRSVFQTCWLGECKPRFEAHEKLIAGLLTEYFFVHAIWVESLDLPTARRGRLLEISGAHENLEMATYVHRYLLDTAERLWQQRPRAGSDRREARREFLTGVIRGFGETLRKSRQQDEQTGLVWTGAPLLKEHTAKRHPFQRTQRIALRGGSAYEEGQAAGRKIVLHRPLTQPSENRGRLFGPADD